MPAVPNIRTEIKVVGDGIVNDIKVGKPASFQVLKSSGGGGVLSFAFEGPNQVEYVTKKLEDGIVEVTYMVKEAGHYEIKVYYQNIHVPGSPFVVHAIGERPKKEIPPELEEKIKKIKVYGKNLEYGKPLALNKVVIDCSESEIDKNELIVSMASPRRRASIINLEDNKDGTFVLTYKPTDPGMYKLNIEVQENHVPGSPFNVNVRGGSIAEYI
ncbi:filamin-C-like protein [Dinothrombium tinctorium]|uniref:Filamin-C-like protein n=1 Tax=Dinothrombium tinctorium TaxID=1965070 RepID=A0A3S4QMQ3_9ACAR|nr:filamin-C-like protein [Dinothrombium tinctorium]RWS05447.1 filamin-C-like protein [Dinothrombium tinctorium]RWS05462.1 filamin-C-like protein [Dinothrombium tinctorium]RWS05508.1 filamin-C-like protein [Dinothrombium tinctorium]